MWRAFPHQSTWLGQWTVFAALVTAQLGHSREAHAQATSEASSGDSNSGEDREARRGALYREGVQLANDGNWPDALKKFQEVVALRSAPAALIALATAMEKSGRLLDAERTYRRAKLDAQVLGDEGLTQRAEESLAQLVPTVPHILVHLPADARNATVTVDGVPILGAVAVDPGSHRIVVEAKGRPKFEERLELALSEKRDIWVKLAENVTPRPAAPATVALVPASKGPPGAKDADGLPVDQLVVGGTGLVVGVVGLIVRASAQSDYDKASSACPASKCTDAGKVDQGNAARNRMLVGTIVAGAGAGALAGAGVWWLVTRKPAVTADHAPPAKAVALGISRLPDGGLVELRGAF